MSLGMKGDGGAVVVTVCGPSEPVCLEATSRLAFCLLIHTLSFKPQTQHSSFVKGLLNQFKIHLVVFYNLSFFSCNFSTLF